MAVVPYTFANQAGQIPLSELDVNFANVKAFAETAGNVTGNIQANITAVGTLSTLSVSGNIVAPSLIGNVLGNVTGSVTGNVNGNISGNFISPGSNTQVLFNDSGIANAVAGMSFNKNTNSFSVSGTINATTLLATGNIVSIGSISATGNIQGGNISTTGLVETGSISATGNIQGGNVLTSGLISSSGNVVAGNLFSGFQISATNNISGANFNTVGTVNSTGNITGGNIITGGLISATGNIQGGNLLISGIISVAGNLVASGSTALSGTATAPTAANGTSNTQIATTAFVVNSITNSAIPAGVILLWSGSIASIPAGWALCNGANGTPDLRNRFIVGAGGTYAVAATGGSADAVVVSHTHSAISSVNDPSHNHINGAFNKLLKVDGTGTATSTGLDFANVEPNLTTTGTISNNTTGITVSTTIASSGVSGTNANLPPYYALAYIMKL